MKRDPSPSIPADLHAVDEMMHLYGEWARKRLVISTCGSVEKKYVPDRVMDDDERRPSVTMLATWKAVDVQRIVQTLPMLERMCLWAQYKADDHGIAQRHCHRNGIRTRDRWMEMQVRGLRMLRNRLHTL